MDYNKFELVPETEKYINILNEEGNEELCQILFSVVSEEYKKTFVVFSRVADIERSYSEDGDDRIEVGAALFKEGKDGEGELFQITEEEDWEIVSKAIAEFDEMYETLAEEHECCCHHEHCHCEEDGTEVCECDCDCECGCGCECEEEDEKEDECPCGCKHHHE